MAYLESVSMADLHRALQNVDGRTPTLRVVVGVNYKNGVSPTTLADWYDLSRTTIYNWLERLDGLSAESGENVLFDAPRPGRPPKLTPPQRRRLKATVRSGPSAVGIDADEWTPAMLRRYIRDVFDTEYTTRHLRDLLSEFGKNNHN